MPLVVDGKAPVERRALALERDLASLLELIELLSELQQPDFVGSSLDLPLGDEARAEDFSRVLDKWGSDKATIHDYGTVYASLFMEPDQVKSVVEIGIGSVDPLIPSHRESGSSPGSSLRAWRELYPNALVIGADIDSKVLFDETGIKCFHVDQCSVSSCENLRQNIEQHVELVDLVIDDGLHEPLANFITAFTLFPLLRTGGMYVIEDINVSLKPIYQNALPRLLHADSSTFLDLRGKGSGADNCVFIARR